jgi:uncharacterized protein DUF3551
MRAAFLAFVTSAAVSSAVMSPASASDYLYCIQGDDFAGGAGDCIFTTRAQCQATASGRTAYCTENRNFSTSAQLSASTQLIDRSHSRHRSH